jgi:hypothetical protein
MSKLTELRSTEKELQATVKAAYDIFRPHSIETERLKELWQVQRNALSAVQSEIITELQNDLKERA